MAQRPRVQVAPLRGPEQRAVLPQAGSTYVKPTGVGEAPVMRHSQLFDDSAAQNANNLIQSLGQLNRSLQGFGQSYANAQAIKQQEEDSLINSKLVRMTDSEVIEAQRNGNFAGVQQNAAKVALAVRHGSILRSQIEQGFASGAVDFTDPTAADNYIRSTIGTYVDNNGLDDFVTAQVGNILGGQFSAMAAKGAEKAAANARVETIEALPASYDLALKRWEDQPEDKRGNLGDYIWAQHDQQVGGLKLSVGEGDAILMRYAEAAAEKGRLDVVDAIFNYKHPKTGGTLGNKLSYKENYLKLQDKARSAYRESKYESGEYLDHANLQTKVQNGEATDEEINSAPFLKGGQKASMITQRNAAKERRAAELQVLQEDRDARIAGEEMEDQALQQFWADSNSGKGHEFTELVVPKDRNTTRTVTRQDLANNFNRALNAQVNKGGMDEAQRFAEEIRFYGGNGLKNERWVTTMKSGAASLTEDKLLSAEGIPESTKQGYMIYSGLRRQNPALLEQQGLNEEDQRVYRMADQAQRYLNLSPEQALLRANSKYRNMVDTGTKPTTRYPLDDSQIERRVGSTLGTSYKNASLVDEWKFVFADAREMGLDERGATEEANNYLKSSYVTVHGAPVRRLSGHPPDFGNLMTDYVDVWVEEYGAKFGEIDPTSIIPSRIPGTDNYVLIDRTTMTVPRLPPEYGSGENSVLLITPRKLGEFRPFNQKRKDIKEGERRSAASATGVIKAHAKGAAEILRRDVGFFFVDPPGITSINKGD